jgi:hypothetical protein
MLEFEYGSPEFEAYMKSAPADVYVVVMGTVATVYLTDAA